jgi:outer membrane immunogenic protein
MGVMKFSTILVAIASVAALAVPAHAADIAVKRARAPAPPPAPSIFAPMPISMWNGLYVGVNGGGGWGSSNHTATINGLGGSTGDFNVGGG